MNRISFFLISLFLTMIWACANRPSAQHAKQTQKNPADTSDNQHMVSTESAESIRTSNTSSSESVTTSTSVDIAQNREIFFGETANGSLAVDTTTAVEEEYVDTWLKPFLLTTPTYEDSENANKTFAPMSAFFFNNDESVLSLDRNGLITNWNLTKNPVIPEYNLNFYQDYNLRGHLLSVNKPMIRSGNRTVFLLVENSAFCIDFDAQSTASYSNFYSYHESYVAVSSDQQLLLSGDRSTALHDFRIEAIAPACDYPFSGNLPSIDVNLKKYNKGYATIGVFDRENKYITIATSHGYIFVWKRSQVKIKDASEFEPGETPSENIGKPTAILGPTQRAVSQMVFGPGNLLLAGYYDGQVVVWDVKLKKRYVNIR